MKSGKKCLAYFCPYMCLTRDISAVGQAKPVLFCARFGNTDLCNELGIWLAVLRMSSGISELCSIAGTEQSADLICL